MPIRKLLSLFRPDQRERWPEQLLSGEQQRLRSNEFHIQLNTAPNADAVFELCKQAASRGVIDAIYHLGTLYEDSDTLNYSAQEAEVCYWRAASCGKPEAQYRLARLYANGALDRPDHITAFHWIEKAAQSELPSAQHHLGTYYEQGLGCLKDKRKAFEWTMGAAKHGIMESWQRVASMYYNGEGIEQDTTKAYAWASLAKEFSNNLNMSTKHILNMALTEDQINRTAALRNDLMRRYRPSSTALESFPVERKHD